MTETEFKGSCLCGAVKYSITGPIKTFQYCYCSRCRKITGSAFSPNIFVPPDQFHWLQGEEYIGRYDHPEAKYFTTCFCSICGSTLPWHVKTGVNVIVPAGTLDDIPLIKPQQNIYWSSRAAWYHHPDELQYYEDSPRK